MILAKRQMEQAQMPEKWLQAWVEQLAGGIFPSGMGEQAGLLADSHLKDRQQERSQGVLERLKDVRVLGKLA
jgi:hypothetical protein